jgi:hypothetical protein
LLLSTNLSLFPDGRISEIVRKPIDLTVATTSLRPGRSSSRRSKPKSRSIPVTGISLFVQETKPAFEADHPEMRKIEVFNSLNQQWDDLDGPMKLQYEKRADYIRRAEARKATQVKHSRSPDPDQSPVRGYAIFVKDRHHSLKEASPEMTVSDRSAKIAEEWRTMSKSEKLRFINIAKRETRKIRRISSEEELLEGGEMDETD